LLLHDEEDDEILRGRGDEGEEKGHRRNRIICFSTLTTI
jgi:hypothetical protein